MRQRQKIKATEVSDRFFEVVCRVPAPTREHIFDTTGRLWKFDFAWIDLKLALEIEGGVWVRGAHNRPGHFLSDMEKYNRAALLGWVVLRCTPEDITTCAVVDLIRDGVAMRRGVPMSFESKGGE